MGAKKGKRLPKDQREQKRWHNVFLGWSRGQGLGRGWRRKVRMAALLGPKGKKG